MTWIHAHAPHIFAAGDPAKGIRELGLPPLEPRALDDDQIRTLKNLCDRLQRFHLVKGRRHGPAEKDAVHAHGRPWRDRAIVFVLLSTGLRREELVRLDLDQVQPNTAAALRAARRARIVRVRGKGKTERSVFLSADARTALADYLDRERSRDATPTATALFLSALGIPVRAIEGLALQRPPPSAATIHRQIGPIAREHGWPVPSYTSVYDIIQQLDPALITLAHHGPKVYGETFDLIHRREASQPNEIWQADHTPLDVWLIGEGGQPIRPWLTVIEDDYRSGGRLRAFCRTCPSRWSSWTCCS
ncbi:MAG: tyrosine-type recombinase/integrase [Roseiflexaceae bacterium]